MHVVTSLNKLESRVLTKFGSALSCVTV